MDHDRFHALAEGLLLNITPELLWDVRERLLGQVRTILLAKNKEYARGEDKLHNFKRATEFRACSPLDALAGMMLKHTTSIYDMIDDFDKGVRNPASMWQEKVVDQIAYLILAMGVLEDEHGFRDEYGTAAPQDQDGNYSIILNSSPCGNCPESPGSSGAPR